MKDAKHNFVLVHGAWHGAWCWGEVAQLIRNQGHTVTTPTQTGLGERRHLLNTCPDLNTFIEDIVQHIEGIEGSDIALVGHSFAGMVISGVADRMKGKLKRLIYLDSGVVKNGMSALDRLTNEARKARIKAAQDEHDGIAFSAPDIALFGIDAAHHKRFQAKLSPQPMGSYNTPLELNHPLGNGLPADYIICTNPLYQNSRVIQDWIDEFGWPMHHLATGHDAMLTDPEATAELIISISNGTVAPVDRSVFT